MHIKLLYVESSREAWAEEVTNIYLKKISNFLKFSLEKIKSSGSDRKNKEDKISYESKKILDKIQASDFVLLCDEHGKSMNSEKFSSYLINNFELGQREIVFVIGGAFGVSQEIKTRANYTLKISDFVLNHHMAKSVVLEQIYRALCIWKNIPYHNS